MNIAEIVARQVGKKPVKKPQPAVKPAASKKSVFALHNAPKKAPVMPPKPSVPAKAKSIAEIVFNQVSSGKAVQRGTNIKYEAPAPSVVEKYKAKFKVFLEKLKVESERVKAETMAELAAQETTVDTSVEPVASDEPVVLNLVDGTAEPVIVESAAPVAPKKRGKRKKVVAEETLTNRRSQAHTLQGVGKTRRYKCKK